MTLKNTLCSVAQQAPASWAIRDIPLFFGGCMPEVACNDPCVHTDRDQAAVGDCKMMMCMLSAGQQAAATLEDKSAEPDAARTVDVPAAGQPIRKNQAAVRERLMPKLAEMEQVHILSRLALQMLLRSVPPPPPPPPPQHPFTAPSPAFPGAAAKVNRANILRPAFTCCIHTLHPMIQVHRYGELIPDDSLLE